MLDHRPAYRPRRSAHPPFARILCALDGSETDEAAVTQALAVADGDAQVTFASAWYGGGAVKRGVASEHQARTVLVAAVDRARESGHQAAFSLYHAPTLGEALVRAEALHDLIVVGAPAHARATGIMLNQTATRLVHFGSTPVLIARPAEIEAGVVVGTRAVPDDRLAITPAAHLAVRFGAELVVVHVPGRDREQRHAELKTELANARALLGRQLDYLELQGSPAHVLVETAEDEGAGLIVVGSTGRRGLSALASVSERVAHLAPCSVLVVRCA